MNIAKNMEAIFFAAIALASATGFATAKPPVAHTAPAALAALAPAASIQAVTVSAKRLSAAEKAALPQ